MFRKRNSKTKILNLSILIVLIISLTIGYAAFSEELTINASAIVEPDSNNFSVLFSSSSESLSDDSVTPSITGDAKASDAVIDNTNDSTISNLNVTFTGPGQSVSYTFYAMNNGVYDAFLNNINFNNVDGEDNFKVCSAISGTSDESINAACDYINLSVKIGDETYTETKTISNHTLSISSSEKIVVTISYNANEEIVDGDFLVDFGDITLVYSTIDSVVTYNY